MNKGVYRVLCFLLLLVTLYTIVSSWSYGEMIDSRILLFFFLSLLTLVWVSIEQKKHYDIIAKQEKELQMYRLYTKPLEELVKEIRIKQHEFDNHMNAILNMHVTIDCYDELVLEQSKYVKEIYDDHSRQFINLLKISDKVLAGFLYSKILEAPQEICFDIHVEGKTILSQAGEHNMIEVVGTLIDNAIEACTDENNEIKMVVGSTNDKLVFELWNMHPAISLEEIGHFFEKGYSTKKGNRGLGLYNAKRITEQCQGELTVSMEQMKEMNYICFRVEL
ncbi:MAG: sensor histidine kinase [Velocimicrobium sp.]